MPREQVNNFKRPIPQPSHGKVWGGNVGAHATSGQGEPKPGAIARDAGPWGGNVGPQVTAAKLAIGAPSP